MKRWYWIVASVCIVISSAQAQASRFIEDLTSTEIAAATKGGKSIALIPIGGTEQNAALIAVGKHNTRARVLSERIAQRLGNALVAPVIAYVPEGSIDPPTGHMRQPGTLTIPEDAFEKTLDSAARSLLKHGFKAVVFLGDHGGYQRNLRRVADRLNAGRARPVIVVPKAYYRELEHAGIEDVELTLATVPGMVRDPRGANVERGRAAAEAIVEQTAAEVRVALPDR